MGKDEHAMMVDPDTPPPDDAGPGPSPGARRTLLVVAADAERQAVQEGFGRPGGDLAAWTPQPLAGCADLLISGIGKANAAAATATVLAGGGYGRVLNLGIAGSLPIADPLPIGASIAATRSIYADEGIALPDGSFVGCAAMGFPLGPFGDWGVSADPALLDLAGPLVDVTAPIATVSTCSGTDAIALEVVRRTWAVAETMEGAAVGHVCARLGVPYLELRIVSNTTGDRDGQRWDFSLAVERLRDLASRLAAALDA
ncbi:MAG: futalosine hydrolase [Planctomycetota bacterium]